MGYYNINFESIELTDPPVNEPISVQQFKDYGRIDDNVDDTNLLTYIKSARLQAEKYTAMPIITQTWEFAWDYFPEDNYNRMNVRDSNSYNYSNQGSRFYWWPSDDSIFLPKRNLQNIVSITTYDINNVATVFDPSNYFLDAKGQRVILNLGAVWPVNLRRRRAVEIVVDCGFGDDGEDVPEDMQMAILSMAKNNYDCRGVSCDNDKVCLGLLNTYRDYGRRGL